MSIYNYTNERTKSDLSSSFDLGFSVFSPITLISLSHQKSNIVFQLTATHARRLCLIHLEVIQQLPQTHCTFLLPLPAYVHSRLHLFRFLVPLPPILTQSSCSNDCKEKIGMEYFCSPSNLSKKTHHPKTRDVGDINALRKETTH